MPRDKPEYQPLQQSDGYLNNKDIKSEDDGYFMNRRKRISPRLTLALLIFSMILMVLNIIQAIWTFRLKTTKQSRVSTSKYDACGKARL